MKAIVSIIFDDEVIHAIKTLSHAKDEKDLEVAIKHVLGKSVGAEDADSISIKWVDDNGEEYEVE